jgi:hypothetical protein
MPLEPYAEATIEALELARARLLPLLAARSVAGPDGRWVAGRTWFAVEHIEAVVRPNLDFAGRVENELLRRGTRTRLKLNAGSVL